MKALYEKSEADNRKLRAQVKPPFMRLSPVTCHLSPVTCHLSPGKSLRVLSTCHSLLANSRDRDFIWVDLQGVESEMEAMSRAVQQLGMRKQVSMGGPHFEKTDFTHYSPTGRV